MRRVHRPRSKAQAAIRGALSRALVLVTLVAFLGQTYLVQTHIHMPATGKPAVVDLLDGAAPTSDHGKAPLKDDSANCPLCQQFASAGQFVTPAAAAILLPSLSISIIEVAAFVGDFAPPVTHIWRGRAPPLG
jgi:hypothetical protein